MRWIVRGALALVGVVVGLVVLGAAALFFIPTERIAGIANEQVRAATGRDLTISGDLRPVFWPAPGIVAEGIALSNADWSAQGPLLRAERLEVAVELTSLWNGPIRVRKVQLDGAALLLERNADGRGNWEFPAQASHGGARGGPAATASVPALDLAALEGAELAFIDHAAGTTIRLRALDAELRAPTPGGPATISASALVGGKALKIGATLPDPSALAAGRLAPVSLSLAAGGTALTFDGQADLDPPAFAGTLDARSDDDLAILTALGIEVPELPRGLGRDRIALTAEATLAPEGSIHLRGMDLALDDNRLTGHMDLIPGETRPKIVAQLEAPSLDLNGLSSEGSGGESGVVAGSGWSKTPLDASALFAADAEISLSSGPVAMGDARLDAIAAHVAVDRGRAVLTLEPARAYGGTIAGDLVANARDGLSTRADLTLTDIDLQPLMAGFADFDRFVGKADARIDLLGVGDDADEIVRSLRGAVALEMGQGEILGLDIPGMIHNLDPNYVGEGSKTVFDRLVSRWEVKGGVMRQQELDFQAPILTASATGEIDLGGQSLDMRLLPQLRSNGFTLPITVRGPWSDPRIRPDIEWVTRQRLEAEREQLEARLREEADEARRRAEEAARAKLAAELDVAPETLSDRDAVERALRDKIDREILNLVTGN
ncbi:AsmA family protein [Jannaschia aquimarina]|uniref:Putative assembly protein n=1 Tax=Jannaschia aquimarina TaxID=935700 RepID=A0A0D1EHQ7_9RHOB|nr:AsmA family protein [Jannaschia aquimarina]KIT16416.1 putative assembly protein [Jannaschia aquimarina]SNS91756.1 AsmA protein [Jannaschia aquimarina]